MGEYAPHAAFANKALVLLREYVDSPEKKTRGPQTVLITKGMTRSDAARAVNLLKRLRFLEMVSLSQFRLPKGEAAVGEADFHKAYSGR